VALSPSEDAVERSVEALIEAATGAPSVLSRRFKAPEGPNGASVAASIREGDATLLLGADLEKRANVESGWDAVLTYAKPATKASLVKVPHHGSSGAHHDAAWSELTSEALAVLTPWTKGANYLPKQDDLDRIRGVADRVFLTAMPSLTRVKKDPAVEKLVRKLHGERIEELRGWGHVRARRRAAGAWLVEVDGDAVEVSSGAA